MKKSNLNSHSFNAIQLQCVQHCNRTTKIMIDFIKANIINSIQDWQKFNSMDFVSQMVRSTGEVLDKKTFIEDSIKFEYLDIPLNELHRVELAGTLHKFYQGGFNYQDFDFKSLFHSIFLLCERHSLNPHTVILENLEIGVNVLPSFNPNSLLNNAFSFGSNSFVDMTNKYHKKIGVKCSGSLLVKLYNKRHQLMTVLDIGVECVRFELHFNRMRIPQEKAGIYTLADLLNPTKLQRLANYLLETFDRITFLNQVEISNSMTVADKRLIEKWQNPIYLENLKVANTQMFQKNRRRYLGLMQLDKFNEYNELKRLINQKASQMLQLDYRTLKQVRFFLDSYNDV